MSCHTLWTDSPAQHSCRGASGHACPGPGARMSVLSKSSGRVLPPTLAPAGFCQRSRIKQSWSVVTMLPKIYGLCQVSFFFSKHINRIYLPVSQLHWEFSPLYLTWPPDPRGRGNRRRALGSVVMSLPSAQGVPSSFLSPSS